MTEYWGRGQNTLFFLLTLYNFKNIGGGTCPPSPPPPLTPTPLSLLSDNTTEENIRVDWDGGGSWGHGQTKMEGLNRSRHSILVSFGLVNLLTIKIYKPFFVETSTEANTATEI